MGFFDALLGNSSGKSSGEQCPYFQGSFCSIAVSDAVSSKCTNGRYADCYYFLTRFSRSESFEDGEP